MSAVRSIPVVLVTLPAGALVDRWDRKWMMVLCDTGRALALGSIPLAFWLGHLSNISTPGQFELPPGIGLGDSY